MYRTALISLLLTATFSANATLQLRGEHMVFDTDTNLTWVRSVGYARGSSFDDGSSPMDGRLTFAAAMSWASNLSILDTHTSTLIGGWRLPSVDDLGAPGCDPAYMSPPGVGIDCGYVGSGSGASELGRLVNGALGNPVRLVPANPGPFDGIPSGFAWLGATYTPSPNDVAGQSVLTVEGWLVREPSAVWPPALVWGFSLSDSFQAPVAPSSEGYAWAVRTGDTALVPEPATAVLFGCGGALLSLAVRRNSRH